MKKTFLFAIFISFLFLFSSQHSYAAEYNFYVNKNSSSETEDGSQEKPYKTVSAALSAASAVPTDQRNIFIANGEYKEKLVLANSVSLTGESNTQTIINGEGNLRAVEISKTSRISGLRVLGGRTGIYVSPGAGATIESCKIEKSGKIGIEIARSTSNDSEKITVTNSEIFDGDGKGFYINARRILIQNNYVHHNKEEGIDIRESVKGTIKKNTITKNGEGGIELIVGKSNLNISNNKITNNSASGIANQFYKESKSFGTITLTKNKIQKNNHYGLECATPSGGDAPKNYWTKSIKLTSNTISGNNNSFASRCKFITKKK